MKRLARSVALGAAGAGLLAGCTVGPDFHIPPAPSVDRYTPAPLPAQTAAGGGDAAQRFALGAPVAGRWWTLFGSPKLDALEDEALKDNADLASAQAALRAAREAWLAQRAAQFPTVDLAASGVRAKNSATIAPPLASNAESYSLYTAQLNITYVIDVFGGVRRQTESAAAQAENQAFLTQAVYLTLTANVANAAVQLASLDSQMDDTGRIIETDRRTLEITRRQQRLGEASTVDVAGAETALEQAEQLAPPLQKQIDQERDLLAALVGRPPSEAPTDRLEISDFQLPLDLPVSLPSQLVRQRPDVRAAEANVHVASALVGVAVAARLPSFSITASPGGASSNIGTLFSNGNDLWSITGSIAQTVFDAGALRHKQKAAEAALDQAKAQYRSTVLGALQNTADVLQAIVDDAETLKHANAAEAAAARSLRLAQDQLAHGQAGSLPVLTAETADVQALIALSQARSARYADTVALYQALGGGWDGSGLG
ncbi:MAG TPA: efflux transporter outer membrane subunit [Caulobacteraceae bacterium]|nr:efflux transporter outer membrane subunit [Caulobacteraceae bacterium]